MVSNYIQTEWSTLSFLTMLSAKGFNKYSYRQHRSLRLFDLIIFIQKHQNRHDTINYLYTDKTYIHVRLCLHILIMLLSHSSTNSVTKCSFSQLNFCGQSRSLFVNS